MIDFILSMSIKYGLWVDLIKMLGQGPTSLSKLEEPAERQKTINDFNILRGKVSKISLSLVFYR